MSNQQKVNQKIGAKYNRRLVLQLLRQHGSLSRRQLADMTGLQRSTLTYMVRELLESDIVVTAGKIESNRVGVKQTRLQLNGNYGWTLGFDLRQNNAITVIYDLSGKERYSFNLAHSNQLEQIPHELIGGLQQELSGHPALPGECLGIGVGVPGACDTNSGTVLYSRLYEARNVPLAELFTDAFSAPALIDHNANLAAIEEAAIGGAQDYSDFIYFLIQHEDLSPGRWAFSGFGTALFLRGELYRGAHFSAGELDKGLAPDTAEFGSTQALELLSESDAELTDELRTLSDQISLSISHLVNLLDPQAVMMGADTPIRHRQFLDHIADSVNDHSILQLGTRIPVYGATMGQKAVATGGAILAAEAFLNQ